MLYINIDGMYGNGAYEKPEYKTVYDLLAEMDRLGVWASVTACAEGKDLSPLYGNRKLMEDIKTAGMHDRIIPCFALAPAMLYAPEEFNHLKEHLANGDVSFVSVYPRTNRHSLREIERILGEIAAYSPVVLISAEEMEKTDYNDLAEIAKTFPTLRFIIQNVMWWQFSPTADLMWRCKNVYIDTARLHFRGAIKSVMNFLGSGRTIFGLGSYSNSGAAIAALSYSGVYEKEEAKIAGLTVLSLMANQKKAKEILNRAKEINPKVRNSFWIPFVEGKGVQNELVIDAHTHIGPMARGWYMPNADLDLQIADIEADMRRFGISRIISTPEPALFGDPIEGCIIVTDKVSHGGSKFKGYLPMNPHYSDVITDKVINKFMNGNYFIGFKIIPEYWRVNIGDPVYNIAWEYANKHHLPILIHTWEGIDGTPKMIEPIAEKYPDAIFILGHSGGGTVGHEEAVHATNKYKNIYLEFCGTFTAKQRWEQTLTRVDKNKVLFGTDTYPHDIAWELGRLLSMDIDDDTLRLILGKNIERVLSMRI